MDIRYLGGVLLARNGISLRRGLTFKAAAEDDYYARNTPEIGGLGRVVPFVAAICLGFLTIGLWAQSA